MKLAITIGVQAMQGIGFTKKDDDYLFEHNLQKAVMTQFFLEPNENTTGGNNKRFFVLHFRGIKLFVAENEVGGLTVMIPEEY